MESTNGLSDSVFSMLFPDVRAMNNTPNPIINIEKEINSADFFILYLAL